METLYHKKYGALVKGRKRYKRLGNKIVQLWVDKKGAEHELDGTETSYEPPKQKMNKPDPIMELGKSIKESKTNIEVKQNDNVELGKILAKVSLLKGDKGDAGAQGPKGDKGDKGDAGAQGPKGDKGDPGKDGKDGKDGKQGLTGPSGIGLNGKDGKDGSPDAPEQIKEKLESLSGDKRLDASAIKNLPRQDMFGGGGQSFTAQTKTSQDDAIPDFLKNKLEAGTNIVIEEVGDKNKKLRLTAQNDATAVWGSITGTLANQTDLQNILDAKVDENVAITGATKTKITYDAKGLVTAGADATQDDIGDGTVYKQYSATEKTKLAGIEAGAEVNNISDVNATDLTDGGATTLHKHDHGGMDGLSDDDHSIYALLSGRAGGQTLVGGSAVTDILKLQGTSGNGTLTSPAIQALVGNNGATVAWTVLNNGNVGIGTTAPTAKLHIVGTGTSGYSIDSSGPMNSGYINVYRSVGIGVSNGISIANSNAADVGTPSRWSPSLGLLGYGWDGSASRAASFSLYTVPIAGTNPITARLGFYTSIANGGAVGELMSLTSNGNVGIGTTSPTAVLHLKASTASANTASLKIDPGVVATSPVSGNIESDGTHLYWTDSGGTRRQLDN